MGEVSTQYVLISFTRYYFSQRYQWGGWANAAANVSVDKLEPHRETNVNMAQKSKRAFL